MDTTTPAASGSPMAKILVRVVALLFLVAVILGECLMAYMYVPQAAQGAASSETPAPAHGEPKHGGGEAKKPAKDAHGNALPSLEESDSSKVSDQIEMDLGKFTVTRYQQNTGSTARVDFQLVGMIAAKNKEDFQKAMKLNESRFREQVVTTMRAAEGSDLHDPLLGLIKRQILEKTNALFGKPLVQGIVVSDFSYIEQ